MIKNICKYTITRVIYCTELKTCSLRRNLLTSLSSSLIRNANTILFTCVNYLANAIFMTVLDLSETNKQFHIPSREFLSFMSLSYL